MPLKKHENILVFSKGTTANRSNNNMNYYPQGLKRYGKNRRVDPKDNSYLGARKNQDGKQYIQEFKNYPTSIIYFLRDRYQHPTQKPVALYEYLIRTYSNPGDTILDFAMGSGTTGVAAIRTGRHFVGIEKEQEYFEIAQARMKSAQPALFVEDESLLTTACKGRATHGAEQQNLFNFGDVQNE